MSSNKTHWEKVYETKNPDQVSWTQKIPTTSLELIRNFGLDKTAKIIDVGGGDSTLVDHLLAEGYQNITVLDISIAALQKAQQRLGKDALKVRWIATDILDFKPDEHYDIWHDRATFHFLTSDEAVQRYVSIVKQCVNGHLAIATFSDEGPLKCSGLEIRQYSEDKLAAVFEPAFGKISCRREDHTTPFDTTQNFVFCSFKRQDTE